MMNDYKVEIKEELSRVINVIANCHEEAVEEILKNGIDIAMNKFNCWFPR